MTGRGPGWIHRAEPGEVYEEFWREYEAGRWERSTRDLIEQALGPGDLFVDIGAWIGPVTLWALRQGARVVAIEPDPIARRELRRRVPDEVEIWEGAVDVRSGRRALTTNHGLALGKSVSRLADEGELQVATWTLAEILGGRAPALVKMDVEGHEIELLPSVAPLLAELGSALQVELHGQLPERRWLTGFREVRMPDDPTGTLVALP